MSKLHKNSLQNQALTCLRQTLEATQTKRILVIGDVMLDVFINGTTERLSTEAPVPILLQQSQTTTLGGASNTAHNLASLNAPVTLIGVVGDDANGKTLQKIAKEKGMRTKLVVEAGRLTTTKTRAVGPKGHLLRIDNESVKPITKTIEQKLISIISQSSHYDAVVVSDYAKGVMTRRVIASIKKQYKNEIIFVDTKPSQIHLYKKVGLVKVNVEEAKVITGIAATSKKLTEEALYALHTLTKGAVVITRGNKGMSLLDTVRNTIHHIVPIKTILKDVSGAGDTALAILALMYVHNNTMLHGAHAANYVASKAVAHEGTTALTKETLLAELA